MTVLLLLSTTSITAQPNIIFIFADQMRAAAMGNMGNTLVQTPFLDALAEGGHNTTHGYAGTPVCTPYRGQLMTGRYSWNTGIHTNDVKMPTEEYSIAEAFADGGYKTGFIGKWHLNAGRTGQATQLERQGYVEPEDRQGFEYWAALEVSHNYFDTRYYMDSETPITINGWEPQVQTDRAFEFIEQSAGTPFLLVMAYGPPHNPYVAPDDFDIYDPNDIPLRPNVPAGSENNARNQIAQYYGLTTSVDYEIGRIMSHIDSLGITENTILVFSSDHGDMHFSHGQTLKQRPWEEAANIPFIFSYPGTIPPVKSNLLINSIDVMPTLLGFAGLDIPDNIDGTNLVKSLTGQTETHPQYLLMSNHPHTGNNVGWSWRAVRDSVWKYGISPVGGWFLYNLVDDPYEMTNLIDDPDYAEEYARLDAVLKKMLEDAGDNLPMSSRIDPPVYADPGSYDLVTGCMDDTFAEFDENANYHVAGACQTVKISRSFLEQNIRINSSSIVIPFDGDHTINVISVAGKNVLTASGKRQANYKLPGGNPSGVYFVRVSTRGVNITRKLALLPYPNH